MRFGPVPVAEAAGAILAHSERAGGRKLAKGRVVSEEDVAALAAEGVAEVWIAQIDKDEVHEDAAATRLAEAVLDGSSGLGATPAKTGRVNLVAEGPGVLTLDAGAIHAANRVHPAVTIATLPDFARMGQGGLAATVKIIPFAAPESALAEACTLARGAMRLNPPVIRSATLIETRVESGTPPDKGRRATATRLRRLDAELTERVVVPHEVAPLAEALTDAPGEMILILTGSATSDIADTAPAAVVRAGGEVDRYGMPVDPGNLIFLGRLGDKPVIGLPGCARSPALNGADWVLERVLCGIPVTGDDIAAMGVGGLLKEMPTRPEPRRRRGA